MERTRPIDRAVHRLAWPLAIVSGVITAAGLTILVLTIDKPSVGTWGFRGFEAILAVETIVIGGLLMSRRPENLIGVLLALAGLFAALQLLSSQYLVAGVASGLPLVGWVSVVYAPIWVPGVALVVGYLPLLFPTGHLLSRTWRWAVGIVTLGTVGLMVLAVLSRDPMGGGSTVPFPYRFPVDQPTAAPMWYLAYGAFSIGAVGGFVSLWQRWRRSVGVEREQLKWFAWAAGVVAVVLPFTFLPFKIAQFAFIFAVCLVPIAVAIAVLRYRLYEVDTVISRTIVYGGLTAMLAGLFAGLQRFIQGAFVAVTGNESDAAWALTALVAAAAFAPLKGVLERTVAGRLGTPGTGSGSVAEAGSAVAADVAPGPPAQTAAMVDEADLEALLRRIVREEVAAALATTTGGERGTRAGPSS